MCSDCAQMIRYVLFAGVVFAAAFTFIWLLFTVALALGNDPTPFTGTGPAFKLWLVCLLVAIVVDSAMRPAARTAVSAFATSLTAVAGKGTCEVRQGGGMPEFAPPPADISRDAGQLWLSIRRENSRS